MHHKRMIFFTFLIQTYATLCYFQANCYIRNYSYYKKFTLYTTRYDFNVNYYIVHQPLEICDVWQEERIHYKMLEDVKSVEVIHADDIANSVILSLHGKRRSIHDLHVPFICHPARNIKRA